MKSIKKLKSTGKAVAGSALLVGATLTGAAGLASAQDSGSMDLGDYPTPFVNEDGEVDSTIVVGEQAQTADVVGAINIAGSLGNAAFMEEEVSVDVGGVAATWTADNGVTLNRQNSHIFFPQGTASEKIRLDDQDVSALETTSFRSEDNEDVEIEHDVRVGDQSQGFNSDVGDLDDPVLHVENPTNPSVDGDYLMQAAVSFDSTIDFTETDTSNADGNADEVLEDGDEIEIFGQEYTYSDESDSSELVLYGSSDRFEVNTGESETVTVDGEEATFEAQYVSDTDTVTATITVDGSTESVEEGDTVSVSGQDVRVSDIYRTGPDGEGRVAFSIGSEEMVITDSDIEIDGDSVDGVDVELDSPNDDFTAVDGITFAFGAEDSDEDYIEAGEMYETPVFNLEFHYGGLSPNAAEDPAETLELDVQEDDNAEFTFTSAEGEEGSVTVAEATGDTSMSFGTEDGTIAQYEGQTVSEDDFVVLNAFEEADMYEITDVDDTDLEDGDSDGTISVTIQNVHTGDSMTIEEDGEDFSGLSEYTIDDESIDGKDFDVTFEEGDDVNFVRTTAEGDRQLWPHMYTATDGAVAFDEDADIDLTDVFELEVGDFTSTGTSWSPGDGSTAVTVKGDGTADLDGYAEVQISDGTTTDTVVVDGNTTDTVSLDTSSLTVDVLGADSTDTIELDTGTTTTTVSADEAERTVDLPSGVASNDADATATFDALENVADVSGPNQDFVQYGFDYTTGENVIDLDRTNDGAQPAVLYTQPENDNDEEEAYVFEIDVDQDGTADINVDAYTGDRETDTMDDDDVDVGYDEYGAYSEYDYDDSDQETFTLNLPSAQATAGMAVTGADGSLSASAGGSGSATTQSATGWPGATALDSEVSGSDRDQNMILVGGPAVNTLTEELAQDNKTWTGDDYEEDTWVLDLVEGFSEDTHALVVAGHSAEDTRAASSYISNYADNEDELAGETTVSMTTSASQ